VKLDLCTLPPVIKICLTLYHLWLAKTWEKIWQESNEHTLSLCERDINDGSNECSGATTKYLNANQEANQISSQRKMVSEFYEQVKVLEGIY